MTRIVVWSMSTLTVLVLLFGYHTSTSPQRALSDESSALAPVQGSAADGGGTTEVTGTGTTVTGAPADTRRGPVQVQLTVTGGAITDVSVVQYPGGDVKDDQINDRALPVLIAATLTAQDADIDMVSGATVTSGAYVESLQSALDQVGM